MPKSMAHKEEMGLAPKSGKKAEAKKPAKKDKPKKKSKQLTL